MTSEVARRIDAAVEAAAADRDNRMQRPFSSAHEIWSVIKETLESTEAEAKNAKKLHGEIWDAVKGQNEEEMSIELRELGRVSRGLACMWAAVAAASERGANEV